MVNTTTVNTSLSHNPSPLQHRRPLHPLLSSIPAGQMVSALYSGHHWAEREKPHEQDSPDETFHPTDLCLHPHPTLLMLLPNLSLFSLVCILQTDILGMKSMLISCWQAERIALDGFWEETARLLLRSELWLKIVFVWHIELVGVGCLWYMQVIEYHTYNIYVNWNTFMWSYNTSEKKTQHNYWVKNKMRSCIFNYIFQVVLCQMSSSLAVFKFSFIVRVHYLCLW